MRTMVVVTVLTPSTNRVSVQQAIPALSVKVRHTGVFSRVKIIMITVKVTFFN